MAQEGEGHGGNGVGTLQREAGVIHKLSAGSAEGWLVAAAPQTLLSARKKYAPTSSHEAIFELFYNQEASASRVGLRLPLGLLGVMFNISSSCAPHLSS